MTECMQACEKLDKSRSPNIENVDEMNVFLKNLAETVYIPGTLKVYPKALSSIWLAITDENEEENWVDWYNGNSVNILDGVNGQLGKANLATNQATCKNILYTSLLASILNNTLCQKNAFMFMHYY